MIIYISIFIVVLVVGFLVFNKSNKPQPKEIPVEKPAPKPQEKPKKEKKVYEPKPKKKIVETHPNPRFNCSIKHHTREVTHAEFSPCGKYLASASEDQTLKLYDLSTLFEPSHPFRSVNIGDVPGRFSISSDGKYILLSAQITASIIVYGIGDKKQGILEIKKIEAKQHHKQPIISIDFSRDSKFILTSSSTDTKVTIFDLKGNSLANFQTNQVCNYMARFSPNSNFLAVATGSTEMKLWEIVKDKAQTFQKVNKAIQLSSRSAHKTRIKSIDFTSDSTKLVTGSDDGTWKLWNLEVNYKNDEDASCLLTSAVSKKAVEYLRVSRNNKILATVSGNDIELWDLKTGNRLDIIENAHPGKINSISFSANSDLICSAADSIRIWNI